MLTRKHTPKAPFSTSAFRTLDQRRPGRIRQMTKNMADDDERSRRKGNPGQNKKPYWQETCIGVWTKSIKGHHVNSEADQDKICNGISVVRIYGKVRF